MNIGENSLMKAVLGDEDEQIVKAGTFAVTRGAGVVAAAFSVGANLTPLGEGLTTDQRLTSSIAVGMGWVLLAAADVLARAYVRAHAVAAPQTEKAADGGVAPAGANGSGAKGHDHHVQAARVAFVVDTDGHSPSDGTLLVKVLA